MVLDGITTVGYFHNIKLNNATTIVERFSFLSLAPDNFLFKFYPHKQKLCKMHIVYACMYVYTYIYQQKSLTYNVYVVFS